MLPCIGFCPVISRNKISAGRLRVTLWERAAVRHMDRYGLSGGRAAELAAGSLLDSLSAPVFWGLPLSDRLVQCIPCIALAKAF
jgi:hypothetical protein